MSDNLMSGIEIDKLPETFSLRIPEITKHMIDGLSKADKNKLNEAILITIAKTIHESKFEPQLYLKETIG
jgi:hypothetical protein